MTETSAAAGSKLVQLLRENLAEEPLRTGHHALWSRLRELGTELWLDTGDLQEAAGLWSAEFTALTTNNTLLNKEIQKGIYDRWIPRAIAAARDDQPGLEDEQLVLEIAFALNARHGLRLVERFGAYVSVELHTDLAHDVERSVAYGRRYHALCPDRFIVKVPLTPAGLLAARRLEDEGIPVNFTLGFAARQNYLITSVARPSWVNVFMGRLNAYVAGEKLGDGRLVGERATLASQAAVRELRERGNACTTRQIGASMRGGEQVALLAGLDVYTMPCNVAREFLAASPAPDSLSDQTGQSYQPQWAEGVNSRLEGLHGLWEVDAPLRGACAELARLDPYATSPEVVEQSLHDAGCGSVFPRLSAGDHDAIAAAGKLPERGRWRERIAAGEVGLDALFTLAGLHSFAKDQAALDQRIRRYLS